jgi:chemotaxis response regulator CheB
MQNGLPAVCGAPSYTAFDVIAVALSLGGSAALARLVAAIPSSFPRALIATGAVDFLIW